VTTLPNYGRAKGNPIATASLDDLRYYRTGCERSIADPAKARFHESERRMLAAIEEEIKKREGGAGSGGTDFGDDNIPF